MGIWQSLCWYHRGPVALGTAAGTFSTLLRDQAAVDAAVVGTPAVVGSDGVEIPVAFLNSEIRAHGPPGFARAHNNQCNVEMASRVSRRNGRARVAEL